MLHLYPDRINPRALEFGAHQRLAVTVASLQHETVALARGFKDFIRISIRLLTNQHFLTAPSLLWIPTSLDSSGWSMALALPEQA